MSFHINIFYAWQTRTDPKFNKFLIQAAIEKAIKNLEGKSNYKDVVFIFDHDTKGIPGSPDINIAISEKIQQADIFICDLTKSGDSINENVAIEYGLAQQAHCLTSIIGICNTLYGEPEDYLPFDINHNRFPIKYSCNNPEEKSNTINQLSRNIEFSIKSIAESVLNNQNWKYSPFFTLKTLEKNFPELSGNYIPSKKTEEIKNIIYENQSQYNIIRLIGLSGLGKTKIMLSALTQDESHWNVRYCDCGKEEVANIKASIEKMCLNNDCFYIVLDNCSQDLAKEINYILKKNGKKLPVLSIFNDRTENTDNAFETLYIDTNDTESIVNNIIKKQIAADPHIINQLIHFASNNPQMAVLIINAFNENPKDNLSILSNSDFLDKLLFASYDSEERIVLQSFSLFDYIGVEDENKDQLKFIATNENITNINGPETYKINRFSEIFKKYLKRQIFEKNGTLAGIRPKPLAWYLLTEWLSKIDKERMLNVINDIQNFEGNHDLLLESMCRQLQFMNTSQVAVEMLNEICGVHGPFANADVVFTKIGSRLLRSFSEINPPAVSGCLYFVISKTPINKLREYYDCRRNLVIIAQKLAFDKRTFKEGADILFLLALAENERWANNATNSFISLFSVYLPGTSVDLSTRIEFLKELQYRDKEKSLFISILKKALDLGSGFFMSGPEKQGTKSLDNYKPAPKEIPAYLEMCLSFLLEEIKHNTKDADNAFCNSINGLCRHGFFKLIFPYINQFLIIKNNKFDYLLEQLQNLLQFDNIFLTNEQKDNVEELINNLKSDDLISEIKYIERNLRNNTTTLSYDGMKKESAFLLTPIAEIFLNSPDKWEGYLSEIYKMDSLYISELGFLLSEQLKSDFDKSKYFVITSIHIFELVETNNTQIFLRFIQNNSSDIFNYTVSQLLPFNKLHKILFQIYGIRNITPQNCDILFSCINENISEIEFFEFYWQSFNFNECPDSELLFLFNKISSYNYKKSLSVIMSLSESLFLFRRAPIPQTINFINSYLIHTLKEANKEMEKINKIFISTKAFSKPKKYPINIISCINQVTIQLLKSNNFPDLAKEINSYLLSSFVQNPSASNNGYYETLYEILIKNYFNYIWDDLCLGLIAKDNFIFQYLNLKNLLGFRDYPHAKSKAIIDFSINKVCLSKFCEEHPEIAPKRLAELFQPYYLVNNEVKLSESTEWLINNYGNDKNVFDAFFIACGNYFVQGSLIPKLEEHKKFAELLTISKNKNIAEWAKDMVHNYEKEILTQRKREEEEKFLFQ